MAVGLGFFKLLFRATALYGTNREHKRIYLISVGNEAFDTLQQISSEFQFRHE